MFQPYLSILQRVSLPHAAASFARPAEEGVEFRVSPRVPKMLFKNKTKKIDGHKHATRQRTTRAFATGVDDCLRINWYSAVYGATQKDKQTKREERARERGDLKEGDG